MSREKGVGFRTGQTKNRGQYVGPTWYAFVDLPGASARAPPGKADYCQ